MEYTVIERESTWELQEKVVELLSKGWKLAGGVCAYNRSFQRINVNYCQAMVKDNE